MPGRLRAFDGLRGLLAAYILAGHTAPFLQIPPTLGWLARLLSHGRGAVELFFILSGMVIMRSLAREGGGRPSAAAFLAARAGRLLPIYLIALALAVPALSLGDPFGAMPWLTAQSTTRTIIEGRWPQPWAAHLAAHLTMTQGLLPPALLPDAEFSILGPAWSLSTEWQFYLLVAALLVLGRAGAAGAAPWSPFITAVMLTGIAGLACAWLPPAWQSGRAFLPHEAWYFALGIASHALLAGRARRSAAVWWALAFLAAIALPWQQHGLPAVAVPLMWAAFLACAQPRMPAIVRPLAAILNAKPLQWLGAVSYPLYLIHMPLQRMLMLALAPVAGGQWGVFTLLWGPPAILLPVIAAHRLHRSVEQPCWRWSRARARRMAQAAGTVAPHPLTPVASGSNTSAAVPP